MVNVSEIIKAIKENEDIKLAITGYLGLTETFKRLDEIVEKIKETTETLQKLSEKLKEDFENFSRQAERIERKLEDMETKIINYLEGIIFAGGPI